MSNPANSPQHETQADAEFRNAIVRESLLPIIVSLVIGALAAGLTTYINQQRFGDRLDRAERDIAINKAELTASIEKVVDRVSAMSVDVSWIRGRLERGVP